MVDGVGVVTFELASVLYRHTKKEAANKTSAPQNTEKTDIKSSFLHQGQIKFAFLKILNTVG